MQRVTCIFLALAAFLIIGSTFTSCATKRVLSTKFEENNSTSEKFDSLGYYRHLYDSVASATVRRDSIVIRDSVVIWKDSTGAIINRESFHSSEAWRDFIKDVGRYQIDDVTGFRLTKSSANESKVKETKVKEVVRKTPGWINWICGGLVFLALLWAFYKIVKQKLWTRGI